MFVVTDRPIFTHVVEVRVPTDLGFATQTCKATFRVMPTEEVATYDLTDGGSSADFLRELIVKLDDLQTPGGVELPYSAEVRDQVLQLSYVRVALARTYFQAVGGAALGN